MQFNWSIHRGKLLTGIRRKDKEITDLRELKENLKTTRYVTLAMCLKDEPYLVTLSHGYDQEKNCIHFHCAEDGKKVDFLKENNQVWGQALKDLGYVQGKCDQLYSTTQFRGKVTFVEDAVEKEHALLVLINSLEKDPKKIINKQINDQSIQKVSIGRIDIEYMSGKRS